MGLSTLPRTWVGLHASGQSANCGNSQIFLHWLLILLPSLSEIKAKLSIEHVMPQEWTSHWPLVDPNDDAVERRELMLQTFGNLTLVTPEFNTKLSNRDFKTKLASGTLLAIDNQVDPTTGTVKAKARFQNARGTLFPSQFVNVRVDLQTLKNVVVVPVTAVRTGPDGDFVWGLNPDKTAGTLI